MHPVEPHLFVIIGGTGNLTRRKLLPALHHLSSHGALGKKSLILGVSPIEMDTESYRKWVMSIIKESLFTDNLKKSREWCNQCVNYHRFGEGTVSDYDQLSVKIRNLEEEKNLPGNRVFYLALPPSAFPTAIEGLGKHGLNTGSGWTRLVIEKPFGRDFESAKTLNNLLHNYFTEEQIYRIDHYLGKETVQNLLVFRFANAIFEPLWNRKYIESIEITTAEKIGIEERAEYYNDTGALRDMIQNHCMQLLSLTAMEIPSSFKADAIRDEKVKILRQIVPPEAEDAVFGQYTRGELDKEEAVGYRDERGIPQDSKTETFVAMRLRIANWRWMGVPFYIKTGKRMPEKVTQIKVTFRCPPISIFHPFESTCSINPNILNIKLQPNEGFDLQFQVKSSYDRAVGEPLKITNQRLHFRYQDVFGPIPDAYETLLLDILLGDQTLFVRADESEEAWKLYTALLEKDLPIFDYKAGTWGPKEAEKIYVKP